MTQSVYLTTARATQALELAEPSILKLLQTVGSRKSLHIVILGSDGEILLEKSVGPDADADKERLATCIHIARSKAQIHFRTGRPSAEIQSRSPGSLRVGDTIWGGSASHEGIIAAASGIQGFYDEAIAGIVASILWGLCMEAQAKYMAQSDKSPIYKNSL
jgi:hypothetical protein